MQEKIAHFVKLINPNQNKKPKLIIPKLKKPKNKKLKLYVPKTTQNQIVQKFLSNKNNNIKENKKENNISNIKENYIGIIPEMYLYEEEKKLISPFSVENIILYIDEKLEKKNYDFQIYKSENLNVYISTFSDISQKNCFGITKYKISKEELYKDLNSKYKVTLDDFSDIFSIPEFRKEWDKNVYSFEILENLEISNEDKKKGLNKSFIQLQIFNSPVFGVNKREMLDKKFSINYNDKLYIYQSSISEKKNFELIPQKENIVRAFTLINCAKYYEDEKYLYLNAYYQTDMKIPIPDTFLQLTVPFTVNNFYKKSFEFFRKFILEKNKSME
jgi:hypothetical protein